MTACHFVLLSRRRDHKSNFSHFYIKLRGEILSRLIIHIQMSTECPGNCPNTKIVNIFVAKYPSHGQKSTLEQPVDNLQRSAKHDTEIEQQHFEPWGARTPLFLHAPPTMSRPGQFEFPALCPEATKVANLMAPGMRIVHRSGTGGLFSIFKSSVQSSFQWK